MNELEKCRKEIDEIDKQLMELFERRLDVAARVAEYKAENELPIYNGERESQVISNNVHRLKNNKYEIVAGERRYRAARLAGLTELPIIIKLFSDQR